MTEQKTEKVTIEVPRPIMAFLRFQAKQEKFDTVEKLIEYDLLDLLRSEFEGMSGDELIAMFNLAPIFWEIFGDERYKPKDAKATVKVMLDKETIEFAEKHNIDINEAVKQHLERLKAAN
jgi:hypothetical protein